MENKEHLQRAEKSESSLSGVTTVVRCDDLFSKTWSFYKDSYILKGEKEMKGLSKIGTLMDDSKDRAILKIFMEERGRTYQIDILDDLASVIWISE